MPKHSNFQPLTIGSMDELGEKRAAYYLGRGLTGADDPKHRVEDEGDGDDTAPVVVSAPAPRSARGHANAGNVGLGTPFADGTPPGMCL